jgi:transcriptional regulator with XRE-family HTH domain
VINPLAADQLRAAIRDSGLSTYAIGQSTAIDKAVLSRFLHGKSGLSVASIDRLCEVLDLELSKRQKRRLK